MSSSVEHRFRRAGFALLPRTLLGLLLLATVWLWRTFEDAQGRVTHVEKMRLETEHILTGMRDAEAAMRGLIFAVDGPERETLATTLRQVPASFAQLRVLTSDSPVEKTRLDRLELLASETLRHAEEDVRSRQEGRPENTVSWAQTGRGKGVMAQTRIVLGEMADEDGQLLESRQIHAQHTRRILDGLLLLSAGALMLTVGAGWRLHAKSQYDSEALRLSEARMRAFVEGDLIGIILWSLEGGITWANDAFLRSVGYTREDLVAGRINWRALTPPEWLAQDERLVAELLATGTHSPTEKEYLRKDGSRLPLLFASTLFPGGSREGVSFVLDITKQAQGREELKSLAQRLQASETQFHSVANSIPQLAWVAEADGAIHWYNQRWYDYTGTSAEQMKDPLGRGWEQVHDPAELPRVRAHFLESVAAGEPWEDTFPLRRQDGEFRWHLSRAMPVRDAEGQVVRWFGTNTDVEDSRRQAAQLRETAQTRDVFLSIAAHELKTPLTPLALRLAQLRREASGTQPGQTPRMGAMRSLEIAEAQVKKLVALVDGLLDVSRMDGGQLPLVLEPLNLARIVGDAVQELEPAAARVGSVLLTRLAPNLVGHFDRGRLAQAVSNLLSNAIKFGAGKPIQLALTADAQTVRLSVRDEGIGIAEGNLERIFGRFERGVSERNYGGLGLGLWFVRETAVAMGGQVKAQSSLGAGATFILEFPFTPVRPSP